MADFDNFESGVPENDVEEDPAAAFLANEREQFAGLEEDLPNGEMNDNGFDGQTNSLGDEFDPIGDTSYDQIPITSSFEPNPPIESATATPDLFSDDPALNGHGTNGDDSYSAISQIDKVRKEPEKIKIWREEQKERLEKKDAQADEKKGEWREVARKELDDWYKNRADQFVKTQETNRAHETAFMKDRDETLPGHEWDHICRLCDFNPKNSKNFKDVSRLRSVLLQLKQSPLQR